MSSITGFVRYLAVTAALALLWAGGASATTLAKVTLNGADFTNAVVGGIGNTLATHSDSGTTPESTYALYSSGGDLTSDTSQGHMEGSIYGGVQLYSTNSRLSSFATLRLEQQDQFTIGAGSTGLSNGAPVKLRVQAVITGNLTTGGRPSGGAGASFSVSGLPGIVGNWVDWAIGGLNPPQNVDIGEYWETEVDTTVGATFNVFTLAVGTLNGTAYDGPTSGRNTIDMSATVRISPAEGYEGLLPVSEAGAPTTPLILNPVPSFSPALLGLLAATLMGVGVIAKRHLGHS